MSDSTIRQHESKYALWRVLGDQRYGLRDLARDENANPPMTFFQGGEPKTRLDRFYVSDDVSTGMAMATGSQPGPLSKTHAAITARFDDVRFQPLKEKDIAERAVLLSTDFKPRRFKPSPQTQETYRTTAWTNENTKRQYRKVLGSWQTATAAADQNQDRDAGQPNRDHGVGPRGADGERELQWLWSDVRMYSGRFC